MQSDLSIHAAEVADASLIVKARIVEAADTFAHMDVRGLSPATLRTFWPASPPDSQGYGYNEVKVRYRPSASAISRAEEVTYRWMTELVEDDERRVVLGMWAMCLAWPRMVGSFRQFCAKTGRVRRTAERRIDQQISAIAGSLIKNAQSLQHPNWSRVSPLLPNQGSDFAMVATPTHWMADGAKPEALSKEDREARRKAA